MKRFVCSKLVRGEPFKRREKEQKEGNGLVLRITYCVLRNGYSYAVRIT